MLSQIARECMSRNSHGCDTHVFNDWLRLSLYLHPYRRLSGFFTACEGPSENQLHNVLKTFPARNAANSKSNSCLHFHLIKFILLPINHQLILLSSRFHHLNCLQQGFFKKNGKLIDLEIEIDTVAQSAWFWLVVFLYLSEPSKDGGLSCGGGGMVSKQYAIWICPAWRDRMYLCVLRCPDTCRILIQEASQPEHFPQSLLLPVSRWNRAAPCQQ